MQRIAMVVKVHVEQPPAALRVPARYREVLLVVHAGGHAVGHVYLPAQPLISAEAQRRAIEQRLGRSLAHQRVRSLVLSAARDGRAPAAHAPDPPVSVIVCTRDRPDHLRHCLDSLLALRTSPAEIIVVDNAPSDQRTRELCQAYPVTYVLEPLPGQTRARNRGISLARGEAVAFTDDDCVVDAGWLDGLGDAFADPIVMAVTGYIGPLELESPAQYMFELHGRSRPHPRPRLLDPFVEGPTHGAAIAGAGANMVLRRRLFDVIGGFAEDLGPGTPARSGDDRYCFYRILEAGYRIRHDPARIVWHRHRADMAALRRITNDYGVAELAYLTRVLARHRDPGALRVAGWWGLHFAADLVRLARGHHCAVPARLTLDEARGALSGPFRLRRSAASRRGIEPVAIAPEPPPVARPAVRLVRETPPLSVALASHQRRDLVRDVLLALAGQDHPHRLFEVVLVLDGCTDGSAEMARALELPYRLRVLEQEQSGVARAHNQGARAAANPVVVFLDDDIAPVPGFLSAHAGAHAAGDDRVVALGYSPPATPPRDLWGIALRNWWEDHFTRKGRAGHRWTFADYAGGNVSLPRSLMLELGGYDERFTLGRRQDWELGIRLLEAGARFRYLPAAKALHHLDDRFATAVRNQRREAHGDLLLVSRHPEVGSALPLANVARAAAARPRRTALGPRLSALADPGRSLRLPVLPALEALGMRRRWLRCAHSILVGSYVRGLAEAVPDPRERRRLLAEVAGRAPAVVELALAEGARLDLPATAGAIDLVLGYQGRALARVAAIDAGGQWDAELLADRVAAGGAAAALPGGEALERGRAA